LFYSLEETTIGPRRIMTVQIYIFLHYWTITWTMLWTVAILTYSLTTPSPSQGMCCLVKVFVGQLCVALFGQLCTSWLLTWNKRYACDIELVLYMWLHLNVLLLHSQRSCVILSFMCLNTV